MKPKVLITRKLPDEVIQKVEEICDVTMWEYTDTPIPRDVLEEQIIHIDGLFCMISENVDEELLNKAQNLKVVSNMAVGYNNIDVEAAKRRGIMVTNTPGVLTETTADLTFALLMATARRIPEASEILRSGEWKSWSPLGLTGQDIYGSTLGIIGMGRIGEAVAKRAKGFDMKVLYHNRNRKHEAEQRLDLQFVDFERLLKDSDFVCIMTPYTPETKDLITYDQLKRMKKTAILINTARGGIVNEKDLYEALKKGEIWAAGLDVFELEPVPLEHPLLTLPNVVTLPHIGSASIATRLKMADVASTNLLQALQGQTPKHLV